MKDEKLHWYRRTQPGVPPYDKLVDGLYGYKEEPDGEIIDKYDLRKVSHETLDELTERYL